jgi:hypothetical protein
MQVVCCGLGGTPTVFFGGTPKGFFGGTPKGFFGSTPKGFFDGTPKGFCPPSIFISILYIHSLYHQSLKT